MATTLADPAPQPIGHFRLPHEPSEWFNFITHLGSAALAVVGLVVLVLRADGALAVTSVAIYGATLIFLFLSSAAHHAFPHAGGRASPLRRMDHVAIYLLIMGTYAPPCLVLLPREWGWPLLAGVWLFGIVGITLKILRPFASRWTTIALYVTMGWMAVIAGVPIARLATPGGLALLAGGGAVYTLGALVYAAQKPDLWPRYVGFHGAWHVIVMIAAAMHYAFVYAYVLQ